MERRLEGKTILVAGEAVANWRRAMRMKVPPLFWGMSTRPGLEPAR